MTLEWRLASSVHDHEHVDDRRVSLGVRSGTAFHVERDPPAIMWDLFRPPEPATLIHPLGTVPIAVLARWRGDVTLHAGAFEAGPGVWGVFGDREAGKSTFLASIAERGYRLVADDLLTVLDGVVWSAPACVDLRPDVAWRFPEARNLGIVGDRPRYRLSTLPGPARSPLLGLFLLEWHDRPSIEVSPLMTAERLDWLYRMEYIGLLGPAEPHKILTLLELPAWRVSRPHDWTMTSDVVDAVLERVGSQS